MSETRAEVFAKYLNQKLSQHKISVATLAEELHLSAKSIYRYKNAENPPQAVIEACIRDYFLSLDRNERQEQIVEQIDTSNLQGDERIVTTYELFEEEVEDEIDYYISAKIQEYDDFFQNLKLLTPSAQSYVATNFEIISLIDMADIELIKKINKFNCDNYMAVVSYLEGIPVNINMILNDNLEFGDSMLPMMDYYIRILRSYDDKPHKIYGRIGLEGTGKYIKDIHINIKEQMTDLLHLGIDIPDNLIDRAVNLLKLSRNDWYLLFLIERSRCGDSSQADFEIDGIRIRKNEYLFRTFLNTLN